MAERGTVTVATSNEGQLAAWDGEEGAYWAQHADHYDRSIAAYHRPLLDAAGIAPTDRVLDVGCGTGQTTRDAARRAGHGHALGVDLSSQMLAVAQQRSDAEGLANTAFLHADAQLHHFDPGSFDLVLSRTAAMFFGDVEAAFTNLGRALRTGGRLAVLVWQGPEPNEWLREILSALAAGRDLPGPPPDGPGPFALSHPDRVRDVLAAAGFADVALDGVEAPMWFGTDAEDAHRFVLGQMGWMLDGADDGTSARAHEGLRATMTAHETDGGVLFGSAAWIITAARP